MGSIRSICWEKLLRDFMARTFTLIAPVHPILHRVSCSHEMVPNATKHYEMQQNMSLGSCGVDRVCLLQKFRCNFLARTFALIVPVEPVSHRVYCCNKTIPNASEHYEIHQNISLGSYGLDQVRSLRNIPTRLRGTNFCTNCTSSARFAPSFTAVIKQSQMHLNTMKHAKT